MMNALFDFFPIISMENWYFVTKIVLTVRKNWSSDREKLLKFEAEGRELAKFLRVIKQFVQTEQFLVTECFYDFFCRFLISNKLEQLEIILEKIIGI